jgi:hypothetical protein
MIGAAGLLAVAVGLEYWVGVPPTDGAGLLAWMETNRTALALLDEVLAFAGLALVAASLTARDAVQPFLRKRLAAAHVLTMLTAMMLLVTAVVGGRFVYPVHEIFVEDGDTAGLVAGLFYGGLHMVWLLLGATAITVVAAVRKVGGAWFSAVGLIVAVAAIAASYPDRLGLEATLALRLMLVGWMLMLAAMLPTRHADAPQPAGAPDAGGWS